MPGATAFWTSIPGVILDGGAFNSLGGAGAEVWSAAPDGSTVEPAIAVVTACHSGTSQEIVAEVTALVEDLLAEGLTVLCGATDIPQAGSPPVASAPAENRPSFVEPVFGNHIEMADLLVSDPVHEVGGRGLPHHAPRA